MWIIVSTPWLQGAGDFLEFSLRGGWKFWVNRGAGPLEGSQKSRGAEDFDEFGKNVLEKFSKID